MIEKQDSFEPGQRVRILDRANPNELYPDLPTFEAPQAERVGCIGTIEDLDYDYHGFSPDAAVLFSDGDIHWIDLPYLELLPEEGADHE